ncbi:MAG TPA: DUF47 family protein [Firmicutes bacterium]|nr:DUF47 family protein [Bacillota bacterium]
MSNIFGWIGLREQRDIMMDVRKHMEQVVTVVKDLCQAIEKACNGEFERVHALHEQLSAAEHKADLIRRELMVKLSRGLVLPPDRQDLVQLVNRIDDVADYAEGASRILIIVAEKLPTTLPAHLQQKLQQFIEPLLMAVDRLMAALEMMAIGKEEKALEACTQVETLEEEGDRMKADFLKSLFALEGLPAGFLLLMHDLIDAVENTFDRAEDTADLVRVLTVAGVRSR